MGHTLKQVGLRWSSGRSSAIDTVSLSQYFLNGCFLVRCGGDQHLHHGYNEDIDRIMHKLIRQGHYKPGLKLFYYRLLDEKMDRNNTESLIQLMIRGLLRVEKKDIITMRIYII
jgi:hypothetical protein